MPKIKIRLNEGNIGSVSLGGVELTTITAISFEGRAGELSRVSLTLLAEVDAEIDVHSDQLTIEKAALLDETKL